MWEWFTQYSIKLWDFKYLKKSYCVYMCVWHFILTFNLCFICNFFFLPFLQWIWSKQYCSGSYDILERMNILLISCFLMSIRPPIVTNRHIQNEWLILVHSICIICVINHSLKHIIIISSFSLCCCLCVHPLILTSHQNHNPVPSAQIYITLLIIGPLSLQYKYFVQKRPPYNINNST